MPSGLIKEDNGVRSEGDFDCDLVEMELHGFAVASRQHEGGAGSTFGTDRTKQISRLGRKPGDYLLLVKSGGPAVCATCQLRQGLQVRAGQQFFGTTPCPVAVGPARDIHPSLGPEVKQILQWGDG